MLNGKGLSGVRITFKNTRTGNTGTRTTNARGDYKSFNAPRGNSYKIIPEKVGYRFIPRDRTVILKRNVTINFEAKHLSKVKIVVKTILDGKALAGVKVNFKNTVTGNTGWRRSDNSGTCSDYFGIQGVKYMLAPEKAGYSFDPPKLEVNLNNRSRTLYFKARQKRAKMVVKVTDAANGRALADVRVTFKNTKTGKTGWRMTDRSGAGPDYWGFSTIEYVLTPKKDGYKFEPLTRRIILGDRAETPTFRGSQSKVKYRIVAVTANAERAGTNSRVTIRLEGKDGKSKETVVWGHERGDGTLEQGQRSEKTITLKNVGRLRSLLVKKDNYHPSKKERTGWPVTVETTKDDPGDAAWFPAGFEITDLYTNETWYFTGYRWLDFLRDDKRLARTFYPTPLRDTGLYEITVRTADVENAGTDADVYLEYLTDTDQKRQVILDNQADNFERAKTDIFRYRLPKFGDLKEITIRHNNRGGDPGWYIRSVEIREGFGARSWYFSFARWLALDEGDGRIQVTGLPLNR